MTKDIDTLGGHITINPKYDLQSSKGDIILGYALDNTSFQIDAQSRKLTVSHSFADHHQVTPSIQANGDFSITYSRLFDSGRISTTYAPNDSVRVQWTDGEWETTIKAPIDGFANINHGIKVSMKRNVNLNSY